MNTEIKIDWSEISTVDDFYRVIFNQIDPPDWHGRNLNALNDSLVTGDICKSGPPFDFIFQNKDIMNETLKDIADSFEEIAIDSVNKNGGRITTK
jgi:RNAse (barnase) inhibitor barstar